MVTPQLRLYRYNILNPIVKIRHVSPPLPYTVERFGGEPLPDAPQVSKHLRGVAQQTHLTVRIIDPAHRHLADDVSKPDGQENGLYVEGKAVDARALNFSTTSIVPSRDPSSTTIISTPLVPWRPRRYSDSRSSVWPIRPASLYAGITTLR